MEDERQNKRLVFGSYRSMSSDSLHESYEYRREKMQISNALDIMSTYISSSAEVSTSRPLVETVLIEKLHTSLGSLDLEPTVRTANSWSNFPTLHGRLDSPFEPKLARKRFVSAINRIQDKQRKQLRQSELPINCSSSIATTSVTADIDGQPEKETTNNNNNNNNSSGQQTVDVFTRFRAVIRIKLFGVRRTAAIARSQPMQQQQQQASTSPTPGSHSPL